jgi:hypothetical protein
MRRVIVPIVAAGLLAAALPTAGAQDDEDVAAWFAMMFTPYGALPPLATRAMAGLPAATGSAGSFEVKYGRWAFDEDDDGFNNFGIGGRAGRVGFTIGYGRCDGCEDGIIMAQVDFESILSTSPLGVQASSGIFSLGVRPSFGLGKPTEGDSYMLAANVDLPLAISMVVGERSRVVPFIAPGIGLGHISGGDDSETGFRAATAAGVGFFVSPQVAIHVAWRKIFIEEGPSTLGVGLSFGR